MNLSGCSETNSLGIGLTIQRLEGAKLSVERRAERGTADKTKLSFDL
jgi:hypothetical protein